MKIFFASALAMMLSASSAAAQTEALYGEPISVAMARKAAAAAIAEASKNNWQIAVAIVDTTGELVVFERIDGTQTGSIALAIDKARTALAYKRSAKLLEDRIVEGADVPGRGVGGGAAALRGRSP
jgi:uncharacterized protein GlcG (DUF336 family)